MRSRMCDSRVPAQHVYGAAVVKFYDGLVWQAM
jgi:hypothetical protein